MTIALIHHLIYEDSAKDKCWNPVKQKSPESRPQLPERVLSKQASKAKKGQAKQEITGLTDCHTFIDSELLF